MNLFESETVELKEIYTPDVKKEIIAFANTNGGTTSAPASEDAIRMMIKMTDGDSFESNRSLIQELTFQSFSGEMARRNLEFTEVQMKNIGILSADDIYTNMGLLVLDQCKHSIKFAVFQGTDKLVFKDRKEAR